MYIKRNGLKSRLQKKQGLIYDELVKKCKKDVISIHIYIYKSNKNDHMIEMKKICKTNQHNKKT